MLKRSKPNVKGESYLVIAWSMFFYFMFMNINPRHIGRYMQSMVQTGEIQNYFGKPLSFLGYLLGSYVGRRLHIFFLHTVFGLLFMFLVLGVPDSILSGFFLLSFLLTFFFCFVLSFCMYICLGLLSFWIEDISPLSWIIDKFVMILGGAYLPVAFFPEILKKLAIWTPFGASQFITSTVYTSWSSNYIFYWSLQFFWIIFFGLLLSLLLKKVKSRLDVNGG